MAGRPYLEKTRDPDAIRRARAFLVEVEKLAQEHGLILAAAENGGRLAVVPLSGPAVDGLRQAVTLDWRR